MGLQRTSGMTIDDYYGKERAWIEKSQTVRTLHYKAEQAIRIEKSSFDLSYSPNHGYDVRFFASQDIFEAMWVCTMLFDILGKPIRTSLNGIRVEWRSNE